eukprot:SM000021S06515  [mRNA]  locus=s21:974394:979603:+ [translate_table: standard]
MRLPIASPEAPPKAPALLPSASRLAATAAPRAASAPAEGKELGSESPTGLQCSRRAPAPTPRPPSPPPEPVRSAAVQQAARGEGGGPALRSPGQCWGCGGYERRLRGSRPCRHQALPQCSAVPTWSSFCSNQIRLTSPTVSADPRVITCEFRGPSHSAVRLTTCGQREPTMTYQADVCQICKELQSSHPLFQGQRVPGLQLVFSDAQLLEYLADSPSIRGSVLSLLIPFKDVYKCPPWLLPAKDCRGDHPFYYFSPSPTSKWHNSIGRANDSDRSAGGGRWKNTGGTPAKADIILYKFCAKKAQPSLDKWQARCSHDRTLGSILTPSKHLANAQGEDHVSGKRGPDGNSKRRPLHAVSQRAYSDGYAESRLLDEEMPAHQYQDLGQDASSPTRSQTTPIAVCEEEDVKESAADNIEHTWPTASTASFSTEGQSIQEDHAAHLLETTPGVNIAPQDASRDFAEGVDKFAGGEEYGGGANIGGKEQYTAGTGSILQNDLDFRKSSDR